MPTSPLRFEHEERVPYRASAALGEDTEAILRERLHLDAAAVARLREDAVL